MKGTLKVKGKMIPKPSLMRLRARRTGLAAVEFGRNVRTIAVMKHLLALILSLLPGVCLADSPLPPPSTRHALSVYTAFGGTYPSATVSGAFQRYTFTGRESSAHNSAGAPMYYRNRQYSPALGRFGRRDPVLDTRNNFAPYVSVRNRPIGDVDPSGMFDCVIEEDDRFNNMELDGTKVFFRSWGFSLTDEKADNIGRKARSENGWTETFLPVLIGKYAQGSGGNPKPSIRSERGDKIVDRDIAYLVRDSATRYETGGSPECTWYAWYDEVQYLGGAWVLTSLLDTETLAHERAHAYIYKAYAAAIYGAHERGLKRAVGTAVSSGGASGDEQARRTAEARLKQQTERWNIVASRMFEAQALPAIGFQDTTRGRWISNRPRVFGLIPPIEGPAAGVVISIFDPTYPISSTKWYEDFRAEATLDAGALYRDLTESGASPALSPWVEGVYRCDGMRLICPPVLRIAPNIEFHPGASGHVTEILLE